jgi:hypothetical protein
MSIWLPERKSKCEGFVRVVRIVHSLAPRLRRTVQFAASPVASSSTRCAGLTILERDDRNASTPRGNFEIVTMPLTRDRAAAAGAS